MNTFILNITVPAKNKKYYERVVLNLYPLIFYTENTIYDIFKKNEVINFVNETVKTKKLYDEGVVYIRDITNIGNIKDEIINLYDLIPVEKMSFEQEINENNETNEKN